MHTITTENLARVADEMHKPSTRKRTKKLAQHHNMCWCLVPAVTLAVPFSIGAHKREESLRARSRSIWKVSKHIIWAHPEPSERGLAKVAAQLTHRISCEATGIGFNPEGRLSEEMQLRVCIE